MKEIKQLNSEEILDKVFELIEIFTNEHKSNQTSKYGEVVEAASQYACDSCRYNVGEPDDEVCGWCLDNLEPTQNFKKEDEPEDVSEYDFKADVSTATFKLVPDLDWDSIREEFHIWHRDGGFPPAEKVFQWFKNKITS